MSTIPLYTYYNGNNTYSASNTSQQLTIKEKVVESVGSSDPKTYASGLTDEEIEARIQNDLEIRKQNGVTSKYDYEEARSFYENVPRMLKDGQGVEINVNSFPRPKIFDLIKETGNIPLKEMYNVFNMGIGFILAVEEKDVESVMNLLKEINEPAYVIGKVTNSGEVDLKW